MSIRVYKYSSVNFGNGYDKLLLTYFKIWLSHDNKNTCEYVEEIFVKQQCMF